MPTVTPEVEERLVRAFLSGMKQRDAAAVAGISVTTAVKVLRRRGVTRPRGMFMRAYPDAVLDEAVRMYVTRLPDGTWTGCKTVHRATGVPPQVLYYHLRKRGIPTRDARESHAHGKRCKPIKNLPPPGEVSPLCACGCGEPAGWMRSKNAWRVWRVGHFYAPDRCYKQADWLYEQYITRNRTTCDIASEFGVSPGVISRYLNLRGIPIRSVSASRIGRKAGANNPAWKGGVTPERQRAYKTQEWKALILACWRRDDFKCRRCDAAKVGKKKMHAHHIAPWADFPELRFSLDNLVTLCNDCHIWVHSLANTHSLFLHKRAA